jgi:signal transduction histidine kinase
MTVQVELHDADAEALRAQLQRQDEFLAVVAHELRAPLGAILGWAHMLRRNADEEDMQKGLEVIEQSVHVQAKLIDDLLMMSRMASNKIVLDMQPLSLAELVETAVEAVRPAAQDKGIRLVNSLNAQPLAVNGDATRLLQVLGNLLTNAVKFTPPCGEVEVSLKQSRGWAVITVADNGKGIAPDLLPHVFDRFRQDPSAARVHGGLGLGLAIARHLVELHAGEIDAQSTGEGKGAAFTVRLPLAEIR